ncbi:hypothetical protein, partial [Ruegeria arenilitoris]|uniref:hypothetical protein n=1 Tax=Ruegeria arenilitoris TaxID=1173585 RepID=UPI001C2BE2AE
RQAHNLKVAGSNPAPATKSTKSKYSPLTQKLIHWINCSTSSPRQAQNQKTQIQAAQFHKTLTRIFMPFAI